MNKDKSYILLILSISLIIIIVLIILVLVTNEKIGLWGKLNREEAEHIALNFAQGIPNARDVKVINSYRENIYWEVLINAGGEIATLEIHSKTGKVEFIKFQGRRTLVDEMYIS